MVFHNSINCHKILHVIYYVLSGIYVSNHSLYLSIVTGTFYRCKSILFSDRTCEWKTLVSVNYNKYSGSVIAAFAPSPDYFNLSMYNIFLITDSDVVLHHLTVNTSGEVSLMSSITCCCYWSLLVTV